MDVLFDPQSQPHRRYNRLTGEWILVSPHRTQRPWQGQRESVPGEALPAYDPTCYLCPGNERAGGAVNPRYPETFVFTNDYAALLPDTPLTGAAADGMCAAEPARGTCRVICFSPRHDLTLARMETADVRRVVDVWAEQTANLGRAWRWVQLFENRGAAMGASNPHPHGQVWAGSWLPQIPSREDDQQRRHAEEHGRPLLLDYADQELASGSRVVDANEHWVMLVPYWAVWPYEYLLLPRRHVQRLPDLASEERDALAEIMRLGLIRYDNTFETPFPYSMGWHGAPYGEGDWRHWQLHAHYYPPLLRSSTVRKFMVGFELLSEPQRDITAEQAAQRLRDQSTEHYASRETGAGR